MGRAADWWNRHLAHARSYANAAIAKDKKAAAEALNGTWADAIEWGDIVGDPIAAALMGEHSFLLKSLADLATLGDVSKADQDLLRRLLKKNSDAQAGFYAAKYRGFPVEKWGELFDAHVGPMFNHLVYLSQGDSKNATAALQQAVASRDEVVKVADRLFPSSGGILGLPTWAAVTLLVVGGVFVYNHFVE